MTKPIRNERIIRIIKRCEVGHFDRAAIRVLALCKELVDRIKGIGLDSVVRCEYDKLGHLGLGE